MAEPAWLTTRDGHPFCLLCRRFAVCNHLLSQGHRDRLERFRREPWDLGAPDFPWPEPGDPAPPEWGDAALFVFHERTERWFCRVCWAYVDEGHLASRRHVFRSAAGGQGWFDRGDARKARLDPGEVRAPTSGRPREPGGMTDQEMRDFNDEVSVLTSGSAGS